ncbi:MAG: TMEM175 family protein [Pseudomonadota bacterium]|nr:TMEM175 family protein [Pseudomonadota bacterium]
MATTHLLKVERLEGLTDGIFAFAMTIMVLNLGVPKHLALDTLWLTIKKDILTNFFIYVGSFIILGTHWIGMNFQLGLIKKLNRVYIWGHIFYLMTICMVPFSANLLGTYPANTFSINIYAINLLCTSVGFFFTLQCAHNCKLYKENYTQEIYHAALRRIPVGPVFYISSLIAAHWNMTAAYCLLITPTILYMFPSSIDRFEEL